MLVGFWDRKFDVWGGCCSGFLFSNRISNRSNEFSLPDLGFKVVPQLNTMRFSACALCWACLNIVRIDGNVKLWWILVQSDVKEDVSLDRGYWLQDKIPKQLLVSSEGGSLFGDLDTTIAGGFGEQDKQAVSCGTRENTLAAAGWNIFHFLIFGFSWFDLTESSLSMLQPENQLYSIIALVGVCWKDLCSSSCCCSVWMLYRSLSDCFCWMCVLRICRK
jgi:hypothetical protein